MNNSATAMMVSATRMFLRSYPKFDRMDQDSLEYLGAHVKLH